MSAAAPGVERARLFVALELPRSAREAVSRWRENAAGNHAAMRLIDPDALHVTLCFLGWRFVHEIEPIGGACRRALRGGTSFELSVGKGLWLPQRRPRVLALRLSDESAALAAVQESLAVALSRGGWYAPEGRPFLPHVTVARARARTRVRPVTLPPTPQLSFNAVTVTLYRSRPGPGGARYEALETIELGHGEGGAADPVDVVRN